MTIADVGDCIVAFYCFGVAFGRLFPKTAEALERDVKAGHLLTPGGKQ